MILCLECMTILQVFYMVICSIMIIIYVVSDCDMKGVWRVTPKVLRNIRYVLWFRLLWPWTCLYKPLRSRCQQCWNITLWQYCNCFQQTEKQKLPREKQKKDRHSLNNPLPPAPAAHQRQRAQMWERGESPLRSAAAVRNLKGCSECCQLSKWNHAKWNLWGVVYMTRA